MTRFSSLRDVMDEEDLLADLLTFDERQDLLFEFDITEEDDVNGTAGSAEREENTAVLYEWTPTRTEFDAATESSGVSPLSRTVVGGGESASTAVSVVESSGVSPLSRTVVGGGEGAPVTVTVKGSVRPPPPQPALGGGYCAPLQSPALVRDAMHSFRTGGSGVGPLSRTVVGGGESASTTVPVVEGSGVSPLSRTVVGGGEGAPVTVTVKGSVRPPPPQPALGGGYCAPLRSPALVRDAMHSRTGGSGVGPLSRTVVGGGESASTTVPVVEGSGVSPLSRTVVGGGGSASMAFRTGGSGVGPPLRAGLLVGDSFARRAGFLPRVGEWEVTVWVPSAQVGKTWAGCVRSGALARKVEEWSEAARRRGLQPAGVAVWLGGNDVYPLGAAPDRLDGAVWRQLKATVTSLARDVAPVTLLGPTPRPRRDAPLLWSRRGADGSPPRAALVGEGEAQWEATAAFKHLDRPVARWLGEPFERDMRIKHVSVGRCVLERRRQGRKVSAYVLSRAALLHYDDDGVHLSPAGYERVVSKAGWPAWLQLAEV